MNERYEQIREDKEELMGALMFSCSGRGPETSSLISVPMLDATRFHAKFPDLPLTGFYAGGEIGPMAMADSEGAFDTVIFALSD